MSHWGIPGPGGSMGKCAVCGEDFAAGVIKDLMGMESGITSFSVGFVDQVLYCHDPDCKSDLERAFGIANDDAINKDQEAAILRDALPDGPLKKVLSEAIDERATA